MRPRQLLPFAPGLIMLALAGAGWWHLRSARAVAESRLAQLHAEPAHPGGTNLTALSRSTDDLAAAGTATLQAELTRLDSKIAAAKQAVELAHTETERWLAKNPVAEDELTSSFGKISDMGRSTAIALRAATAYMTPGKPPSDEQLEDIEAGQVEFMKLVTLSPQLGDMESVADHIARFQSAALAEFYGLDEETAGSARAIIAASFAALAEKGLTVPDRPPVLSTGEEPPAERDPREDWRARRSAELEALMVRLRPLLPAGDPKVNRAVLPMVLNIGVGMQTTILPTQDGGQTASMGLPTWPTPPWLKQPVAQD